MSLCDEANRLFEAIKGQYELDGTIDPLQKAMLLKEMEKLAGGEEFAQQINEVFEKLDKDSDFQPEIRCEINRKLKAVKKRTMKVKLVINPRIRPKTVNKLAK